MLKFETKVVMDLHFDWLKKLTCFEIKLAECIAQNQYAYFANHFLTNLIKSLFFLFRGINRIQNV